MKPKTGSETEVEIETASKLKLEYDSIQQMLTKVTTHLIDNNISYHIDKREIRPGNKYYEWERKGIPIRITIGKLESMNGLMDCVIRLNGEKRSVTVDTISELKSMLKEIHLKMLIQAEIRMIRDTKYVSNYQEFLSAMQSARNSDPITNSTENNSTSNNLEENWNNSPKFFLVPWKENTENELKIKEETKFTIRCYPFVYNTTNMNASDVSDLSTELKNISYQGITIPILTKDSKCFYSNETATHIALFARAF